MPSDNSPSPGELPMWSQMNDIGAVSDAFDGAAGAMPGSFSKRTLFGNLDLALSDLRNVEDIDQVYNSCDPVLPMLSGGPDPSADLFALIKQQQQLDDAETAVMEEQRLDAQIEHLLQLKAQMQAVKQAQQPVIMENAQFQTASFPAGAVSSGLTSLALDSNLLSSSAFIEVGQDWPWLAGTKTTAAATKPARHSIDMGGLTVRMAGCDINSNLRHSFNIPGAGNNLSNSFTLQGVEQQQAFNLQGVEQQQAFTLQGVEQQQAFTAGLPAGVSFGSAAPLAGLVNMPAVAGNMPALGNAQLQSMIYASTQLPGSNLPSFESPLLPAQNMLAQQGPPTGRTPGQRRMSLDLSRLQAYGGPMAASGTAYAAVAGHQNSNSFDVAYTASGLGAQACWAGGFSCAGCPPVNVRPQRVSMDLPSLATPDNRCPPRAAPSGSTSSCGGSGSARNSPTSNAQQQQPSCVSVDVSCIARGPGTRGGGGGAQLPLHQAPKWAGSQWNPMNDVVRGGSSAVKGTGVFIPGGGVPKVAEVAKA